MNRQSLRLATITSMCAICTLNGNSTPVVESVVFGQASQPAEQETKWIGIPPVLLTAGHERLCCVQVNDQMPVLTPLQTPGGLPSEVRDLYGNKATVICFWKDDRRMARTALADLQADVVTPLVGEGVAVIAIAVQVPDDSVRSMMDEEGLALPMLIDADGSRFAKVGKEKLPRIYVLNQSGTIVWFDMEYSQATRRELRQALKALLAK